MNTYPLSDPPLHRNRAEITVLVCEQKSVYPVWFSCQRKTYPV